MSIYIDPPKSYEQSDYRAEKPESFHLFAELLSESSHSPRHYPHFGKLCQSPLIDKYCHLRSLSLYWFAAYFRLTEPSMVSFQSHFWTLHLTTNSTWEIRR